MHGSHNEPIETWNRNFVKTLSSRRCATMTGFTMRCTASSRHIAQFVPGFPCTNNGTRRRLRKELRIDNCRLQGFTKLQASACEYFSLNSVFSPARNPPQRASFLLSIPTLVSEPFKKNPSLHGACSDAPDSIVQLVRGYTGPHAAAKSCR